MNQLLYLCKTSQCVGPAVVFTQLFLATQNGILRMELSGADQGGFGMHHSKVVSMYQTPVACV